MTLGRAVRGLAHLSFRDVLLVAEAQLALAAAQATMGRRAVGELIGIASSSHAAGDVSAVDLERGTAIGRAVFRAASYGLFRPLCLVRSIALQRMLNRRGIASDLKIGTRLVAGKLEAHAWVELGGTVIGDTLRHVGGFAPVTDERLVQL